MDPSLTAGYWPDDVGNLHPVAGPSCRIVCLVPSITELLLDLGLGANLVGRTGFCIHPASLVKRIPKVGGTKDVDLEKIRELRPTHAVVNVDENRRSVAQRLAEFVPHVIITHPWAQAEISNYIDCSETFSTDRSKPTSWKRSFAKLTRPRFERPKPFLGNESYI